MQGGKEAAPQSTFNLYTLRVRDVSKRYDDGREGDGMQDAYKKEFISQVISADTQQTERMPAYKRDRLHHGLKTQLTLHGLFDACQFLHGTVAESRHGQQC